MTTNPKQAAEQTYIDILLGRIRVKSKPKKSPIQDYVNRLVNQSRRDRAKQTEAQARAALLQGC